MATEVYNNTVALELKRKRLCVTEIRLGG